MNKRGHIRIILGYIIAIIGIIGLLAWAVPEAKTFIEKTINFKIFSDISDMTLLILSIIISIIGIFITQKFSHGFAHRFSLKAPPKEVPIYQGKHIIGFRRRY